MAERCDLTELMTSDCAHCRGLPDLPTRQPRSPDRESVGPTIVARYGGRCADCGRWMREGQLITYTDDGWIGECCAGVTA